MPSNFTGNIAGEKGLCLLPPSPHHHHYSYIHVPHLSNQILGCVHSAVALYMNYKPAYTYFENIPSLSTGFTNMKHEHFSKFILFIFTLANSNSFMLNSIFFYKRAYIKSYGLSGFTLSVSKLLYYKDV